MASHGLSLPSLHGEGLFDMNALKHLNPGLWRASKSEEVLKGRFPLPPGKNVTQMFLKKIKPFRLFKLLKVRQKSTWPFVFPADSKSAVWRLLFSSTEAILLFPNEPGCDPGVLLNTVSAPKNSG